jgi:hypothetical protein
MNERILELKQQAEAYVDSVDDGLGIERYRQSVDLKFAELIVRECVANLKETKKAELPLLQAINENAREVPLSVYIVFLKEHFGVEE